MQQMPRDVEAVFDSFPPQARHRLAEIRAMILVLAAGDARIGAITEALKWGEPAYLTEATGSGSTIRLGLPRGRPDHVALFFICRTTLVDRFRDRFGKAFDYDGTRAVLLPVRDDIDRGPVEAMLAMALTYHLRSGAV